MVPMGRIFRTSVPTIGMKIRASGLAFQFFCRCWVFYLFSGSPEPIDSTIHAQAKIERRKRNLGSAKGKAKMHLGTHYRPRRHFGRRKVLE